MPLCHSKLLPNSTGIHLIYTWKRWEKSIIKKSFQIQNISLTCSDFSCDLSIKPKNLTVTIWFIFILSVTNLVCDDLVCADKYYIHWKMKNDRHCEMANKWIVECELRAINPLSARGFGHSKLTAFPSTVRRFHVYKTGHEQINDQQSSIQIKKTMAKIIQSLHLGKGNFPSVMFEEAPKLRINGLLWGVPDGNCVVILKT